MACKIITIAMSTGAHAEKIGQLVADLMGFRYVNEEIIGQAAARAGLTPDAIAQVEQTKPLAKRILGAMSGLNPLSARDAEISSQFFGSMTRIPNIETFYQNLIREVIHETAAEGSAVIVAHGASIYLAGTPGLVRAFVTASPDTRADRLAIEQHLSTQAARKEIDRTDHERQAFLQRFYDIRNELPTHYDLVLNTDVLSPAVCAQAIATAAKSLE